LQYKNQQENEQINLIIGAGPGISNAMAQKFGQNGYRIGLINRNVETAKAIINGLAEKGITAFSSTAMSLIRLH